VSVAEKIAALVESLRREGFETMPPAQRRHLRDLCRFIAARADPDMPRKDEPKAGVLSDLQRGQRAE
jgi:hypothetical protein